MNKFSMAILCTKFEIDSELIHNAFVIHLNYLLQIILQVNLDISVVAQFISENVV